MKRGSVEYRIGDSRELIRELPDSSVDFVTCSPPYRALGLNVPKQNDAQLSLLGGAS